MSSGEPDTSGLEGGLYAFGGNGVIACVAVFAVLCTTFLVLRFMSIRIGRRPAALEDWVMIPAWFLVMGLCVNLVCSVKYGGVGRHEAYILKYEPEAMIAWAQTLFATELIYGLLFPLEKTSILLLYARIFGIHRWFRITSYVLIAYIWMWGLSELLVAIFQCHPVAYQWDRSIDGGSCINQLAYYRWVSVPNIIHDVAMLLLPIPMLWKLQINMRQKFALSCVLLLASVGCMASFIRLSIFFSLNALSDNTWASVQLQSWTLAEPGVIFICACMPALWPLVRQSPCAGSLRSKARTADQGSDGSGSKERGVVSSWHGHQRSLVSTGDHFIPLRDVEEMDPLPPRQVMTYTANSAGNHPGGGISISREIAVGYSRQSSQ